MKIVLVFQVLLNLYLKNRAINFSFKKKIFIPKNIEIDKKNELQKKDL